MVTIFKATKLLSLNDIGSTGSHQSGILIPKNERVLRVFPSLDPTAYNPDRIITVEVPQLGSIFPFRFVYYNNRRFGSGSRDEYRLTRMTGALRDLKAKEGDRLEFSLSDQANLKMLLLPPEEDYLIEQREILDPSSVINSRWRVTIHDQ
jgi:hypothetical protein